MAGLEEAFRDGGDVLDEDCDNRREWPTGKLAGKSIRRGSDAFNA